MVLPLRSVGVRVVYGGEFSGSAMRCDFAICDKKLLRRMLFQGVRVGMS